MRDNSDRRQRRPEEIADYARGWEGIFGKKAPEEDPKEPSKD